MLVGLLCGGCFVLDEIDSGVAIMDSHTPDSQKAAAKAATVGTAENSDGTPKNARERLNEYYAKQRAKAPASAPTAASEDKVGQCRIRGTTYFTRRSDCQLRGGSFR
jgi:hypothetical protein